MPAEKIGSGRRFRSLEAVLAQRRGVKNPAALAAAIGRKKLGARRMAQLARAGRERTSGTEPEPPPPARRVKL